MRRWPFVFLSYILFVLPITSAAAVLVTPPNFTKTFSPDTIAFGGTSTLTFTIDNTIGVLPPNVTDLAFTDNLPTGVVVADPSNASTTCDDGLLMAVAGSDVISYTGGKVLANQSCTVTVDVTSSVTGTHVNTTGDLTSSSGISGPASDSLVVGNAQAPTVTTQAVSNIGTATATGNGNITDLGAPNPTQHGVCWSTSANPTIALPTKTEQGVKDTTGAFTSNITGLSANTTYHVRAYATNTAGTAYGADVSFTTSSQAPTITDFDPKRGGPGTVVIITGTNFTGTTVKFGGTDANSFTVDSTTQITAVVGEGSTGKVTVTTDDGTATSADDFIFEPSIPTLNEWGVIIFGLLIVGIVFRIMRRQKVQMNV